MKVSEYSKVIESIANNRRGASFTGVSDSAEPAGSVYALE